MSHRANSASLGRARSRDIPGLHISCSANLYRSELHDTSTPIAIKVLPLAHTIIGWQHPGYYLPRASRRTTRP
jgi:hypothetical protein